MRGEYIIYNEKLDHLGFVEDYPFEFIKLDSIPTPEEAKTVEWRTLDLMNHYHYCKRSVDVEIGDLKDTFREGTLDKETMITMTAKYGNKAAKYALAQSLS